MKSVQSSTLTTPRTPTRFVLTPQTTPSAVEFTTQVSTLPFIPIRQNYPAKIWLDRILAAVLFVAFLPVMLLTMLCVRLTSQGPSIYTQTRVGVGGRNFTIYKIRTMTHQCEKETGIQWSTPNDPRITPIGRILRVLHLDELPQLWNVLRGEMSLIGPRPERPEIVEDLRLSVYGYDYRLSVKPGVTGFAQIHLPPDSNIITVHNKCIYDRYYIQNMSFAMDIKILMLTALKMVGMRRLYCRPPRQRTTQE